MSALLFRHSRAEYSGSSKYTKNENVKDTVIAICKAHPKTKAMIKALRRQIHTAHTESMRTR